MGCSVAPMGFQSLQKDTLFLSKDSLLTPPPIPSEAFAPNPRPCYSYRLSIFFEVSRSCVTPAVFPATRLPWERTGPEGLKSLASILISTPCVAAPRRLQSCPLLVPSNQPCSLWPPPEEDERGDRLREPQGGELLSETLNFFLLSLISPWPSPCPGSRGSGPELGKGETGAEGSRPGQVGLDKRGPQQIPAEHLPTVIGLSGMETGQAG